MHAIQRILKHVFIRIGNGFVSKDFRWGVLHVQKSDCDLYKIQWGSSCLIMLERRKPVYFVLPFSIAKYAMNSMEEQGKIMKLKKANLLHQEHVLLQKMHWLCPDGASHHLKEVRWL